MKRSFDLLSTSASSTSASSLPSDGIAVSSDDVFVRQSKKCVTCKRSSPLSSSSSTPSSSPSTPASSSSSTARVAYPSSSPLAPPQLSTSSSSCVPPRAKQRGTCDLDVHLQEEGLLRSIFAFLDVREHQRIRACCRSWRQLIQTLDLDVLDMSYHSPLTSATIDRAFLSVIHNYNRVRHLDLSGQRSLNDRDLLVLASCFWSHLEHISVNDCLDITDFGLLSVLNAQSLKLTSVSMRHCKQIMGNFSTQQITGRHPALVKLDFYDTRVGFNLVNNLGTVFPSLQEIHAVHTPAHLEFFQHIKWQDLVDDLLFFVTNEMVDLPHLQGLLAEFAFRTRELRNGDSSADSSIRVGREGKHKDALGVFQRTLLGEGHHALLDVPLLRGEWNSALLFACENGLIKVIPELLAACGGCACDVTDKDGASPLCVAVTNGLTDAVKILLQNGADMNKRTYSLATPLYIASEMNWDDIIDVLLRNGAQTDCAVLGGATALCVAAKNGNRSTVLRLLAAEQMRASASGASPTQAQASREQLQFVQALFLACERGHTEIVADIFDSVELSANVLMDNSVTALYLACQMGHDDIVELLLQRGANPNFRRPHGGVSCLYIAAQEGKHRIVERLIRANVNIHARMEDLSTALHIAARMGHLNVAQVLLHEGSCIDDQTRSGLTPLYIACEEGHVEIVQFLLSHHADLNRQTKNGTTPLFVASQKGHAHVVRALLVAGADVQLPKHNGTCPMDAASLLGNYEVTKLLLQFGARVGGLSLHFAERRRDLKLQALLMDRYYAQHFQQHQVALALALTSRPV